MRDYTEVVTGRVVDQQAGSAISGAEVEVYDKDLLLSDFLGTATTGSDGRFRVEFAWSDFKDNPFEERPDIFLKVKNPGNGKVTKSKVFEELSGTQASDNSEEIMDLGDIAVE